MSAPTPGPWRWTEAGVISGPVGSGGANVVCEAPARHLSSYDNWHGNAPLLSAALDLLAAAESARRALSDLLMSRDPIVYSDALRLLDEAIAKAGGAS